MGVSFFIVNLDKRQYLDPMCFGDNEKISGYMRGRHASAVALLVCDPNHLLDIDPLAGAWSGDRIVAVPDSIPPNALGVITATEKNPTRNLYEVVWREFQDISTDALIIVCNWVDGVAERLAQLARHAGHTGGNTVDEYLLWQFGKAASSGRCPALKYALQDQFGPEWQHEYERVKVEWEAMKEMDAETD